MISATRELLKWRYDNPQENVVLTEKKNRYAVDLHFSV